ncbi:GA20OX1, partial [Symbiodinium natans]
MFHEHDALRFIPGRESQQTEPDVDDEALEDVIKSRFRKFVVDFQYFNDSKGID